MAAYVYSPVMLRRRSGTLALIAILALPPAALAQEQAPGGAVNEPADDQVTTSGTPVTPPVNPPAPVDQPFKRMLPNFWHDITHFPSLDTGIVLGIGGALAATASQYDEKWTAHASAGGEDQIFTAGGGLGSGGTQLGIAVGAYAVGRLAHQDRMAHVGADLIRAQLVSGVITHSLKLITRRERPAGPEDTVTASTSFPSGHSSATWTTATVLWRHLGWKVGIPASLLASFASASRLQQNAHYMSDVLFGAAIGVASGRTVTFRHGERQISVAPTPVAGGAAITFTLEPQ